MNWKVQKYLVGAAVNAFAVAVAVPAVDFLYFIFAVVTLCALKDILLI